MEVEIKKVMLALAFLMVLSQSGCAFLGGAAVEPSGQAALTNITPIAR
jgi:hypothetical protein